MTEAPQKKDVVPSAYRDKYKATGGTNGDFIALALKSVGGDGLPALKTVMKENKIPDNRWGAANVGMQRMNLSNVLRSTFLNGGDVYIMGKQYNLLHMRDDYNGTVENTDKSLGKFAETIGLQNDARTVKALRRTLFEAAEKAKKEQERVTAKAEREKAAATKKTDAAAAKVKKTADAAAAKADKAAKAATAKAEKATKAETAKATKAAAKPAKAEKPAVAEKVKEPA